MKRIYICGSFRFVNQIEELEKRLTKENIEFEVSKNIDAPGIMGCLEKIDNANMVYVVDPDGYVGKSVSVDIGYAFARKKPIFVMHKIDDPPIMNLVQNVLSFEELIDFLKHNDCIGTESKEFC